MNIPREMWDFTLKSGATLHEIVKGTEPIAQTINPAEFVPIWLRRRDEAELSGNSEYIQTAKSVVHFLEINKLADIQMLIWTEGRVTVLFNPLGPNFLVVQ